MYNTIHAGRTSLHLLVAALCAAIALLAGALALENAQPAAAQTTADCEVIDLGTLSEDGLEASGSWTTEDCDSRFRIDSDAHTYRFEVTAPGRIRIELRSPEGDSYLYLLTEDETRIADEDDGGAILDARIERDFAAGVYLVEATTVGGRARGPADFTLSIQQLSGCEPVDLGALEPGGELTASGFWTLDTCGSRIVASHPAHNYTFTLPQSGRVVIDLTSEHGDPVLSLASPERGVIGANDDGGVLRNSRIESYLPAGLYLIEATTYLVRDLQPLTSDFELVVRLLDEEAEQRSFNLKVEAVHTPDQVIAGEPFAVDYRVGNFGLGDLPDDGSYTLAYARGGPRWVLDVGEEIEASPERWQAGVSYHSDAVTASATSVAIGELQSLELTIRDPGPAWVFVGLLVFDADDEEIGFHGTWRNFMVVTGPTFDPVTISIDDTDYLVSAIPSEGVEPSDEDEEGIEEGTVTPEVTLAGDPESEIIPKIEARAIYIAAVQEYLLAGIFERPLIAALGEPGEAAGEPVSLDDLSRGTLLAEIGRLQADALAASGLIEALGGDELFTAVPAEDVLLGLAEAAADSYAPLAAAWAALQARIAEGEGLTLDEALTVHMQLTYAEAVVSPAVTAGAVVDATRAAADGDPPAVAEWLTADLAARAGCGAGPAHLRAALAAAGVEDTGALLALDGELRFALPLYRYATNAALCAAFGTSSNVSRFMDQLGIEDSAEHSRLIPPPPPAPKVAPGPQRLRVIVQLAEDGRLEHAVEFASGETFVPRKRFLEVDAEVDRWKISTLIEQDGHPVGWIRARRLADGRVEIGFRDANGVAIAPDVRFVPADLRPGEWMRSSEFVAPPQDGAGQPASGTDSEMADGPPRFPVTGGGG